MLETLQKKIETYLEGISLKSLLVSAKKISGEYRAVGKLGGKQANEDLWAYLLTRMPATYAALSQVFEELKRRAPEFVPKSLLDVGAGPATTLWAAEAHFDDLERVHLLEKDPYFISLGKHLAEELSVFSKAMWTQGDMTQKFPSTRYDLVVASYSLGELTEEQRQMVVLKLWEVAEEFLILIEPGTPQGFERMRTLRTDLIAAGAHMVAPCPHANTCPMSDGDWCHFSARLNRSSMQRKIKEAELNYEDEKFTYLIFSRNPVARPQGRILRHPRKGNGHVRLTLCTEKGVLEKIATKKDKELYKFARKASWGDAL